MLHCNNILCFSWRMEPIKSNLTSPINLKYIPQYLKYFEICQNPIGLLVSDICICENIMQVLKQVSNKLLTHGINKGKSNFLVAVFS